MLVKLFFPKKKLFEICDPTTIFLALLEAIGFFFGHPNPFQHVPLLALLCPATLFLLAFQANNAKHAFFAAGIPALLGLSAALYWISIPISVVGELPLLFAVLCVLALGMYLACYYGFAAALVYCFTKKKFNSGKPSSLLESLFLCLCCGIIYGSCELLIGKLFTGFPWLPLATAFVPWPTWIQAASLFGNNGQSTIMAFAVCLLVTAPFGKKYGHRILSTILALTLLVSFPLYGVWRLSKADNTQQLPLNLAKIPITIGLVQGNIDQMQKWESRFQNLTIQKYIDLSRDLMHRQQVDSKNQKIDFFLWPETAIPVYFDSTAFYAEKLSRFAKESNAVLGFGTLGYKNNLEGKTIFFNRFQTISAKGIVSEFYDKVHLVPFGEYIPLQIELDFLKNILQGMGFSQGSKVAPVEIFIQKENPREDNLHDLEESFSSKSISLGVLICYEAIFPDLARQQVAKGASLLVNISNDAWFGFSSAPAQHLALVAMRAVEQQRYLARSTNTGFSALIDPYGRILFKGNLFTSEASLVKAYPLETFTLYYFIGPWIDRFLLLSLLLISSRCFFRRGAKKTYS